MSDKLSTEIQQAMNEARILILGTQVLMGFQMRSVFEKGFDKLAPADQMIKLGGLGLLIVAFALLVAPSSWHIIAADSQDRPDVKRATTLMVGAALLPFGAALGCDLYMASHRILDSVAAAAAIASIGFGLAMSLWYVAEIVARSRHPREEREEMPDNGGTLSKKIDHLLTEARMVLPGSQALLGFQLAGILQESFESLPHSLKLVHLAALCLVTVSTVLLMMPAAWHRIVEHGEETEQFLRFARWPVTLAMPFLALGIVADLYVVVDKVTASAFAADASAGASLALFVLLWFLVPAWGRGAAPSGGRLARA